jgi:hypothetical protein
MNIKKKYCKKDLIVLENTVVPITTINNNNINNGTINNNTINNNHITINQLGKESVDCLPINDILKILSDANNMYKKIKF